MNNNKINIKLKSVEEVLKVIQKLSKILLISNNKAKIINTFKIINCILKGECICDICDTWDKNTFIVFEFGRCLFPSHFLQLLKAKHIKTERWEWMKPLYIDLYKTLYEDIFPDTYDMASLEQENKTICKYKLSPQLIKNTIQSIKNKKMQNIQKQKNNYTRKYLHNQKHI